ncbi:hypothetical protein [Comamonas sp. NLF-1-9]|uniref:hypothetical protein n=1 Tax=Comamonas sp. NLF-1-9 TaxID=2853163 RepID=UPI001C43F6D0|nr:hypothetical protein [Comamonas sp. NLF-1-9]QXL84234.1 hypothetical protein KUD94_13555 [Comamonas sp. NLF-1-9]
MWPEAHQAAGLLGFVRAPGVRLVPVLSHPEATLELEVLWQLALRLQQLGHATLVLDATAAEAPAAPGLLHWLHAGAGPRPDPTGQPMVAAAAQGLAALQVPPGADALERLEPLLRAFSAVLLYAPPAAVAALLGAHDASALVLNVPGDAAVLRSYALLKQMAAFPGVHASLATVTAGEGQVQGAQRSLQALREGCARWLGASPRAVLVNGADAQALGALALRLLEQACTLAPQAPRRVHASQAGHAGIRRYHGLSV